MEIKKIKLSAKTEFEDYGSQKALRIYFDETLSNEICLAFMLLYRQLVDTLLVEMKDFSISLKLNQADKKSHCVEFNKEMKLVHLSIFPNALGSVLNFLLKYYRDGYSRSEHVDLDFKYGQDSEFTLTIVLDKVRPLSKEEFDKLLED